MCVRKISAQCVLQFTPSLAAGCVLHRPVSRVIHCSELYFTFFKKRSNFAFDSPPPGGKFEEHQFTGIHAASAPAVAREQSPRNSKDAAGTGSSVLFGVSRHSVLFRKTLSHPRPDIPKGLVLIQSLSNEGLDTR